MAKKGWQQVGRESLARPLGRHGDFDAEARLVTFGGLPAPA